MVVSFVHGWAPIREIVSGTVALFCALRRPAWRPHRRLAGHPRRDGC